MNNPTSVVAIGAEISSLINNIRKAKDEIVKFGDDLDKDIEKKVNKGMKDNLGKLKGLGEGLSTIGKDLSMKISLPLMAAGGGALKAASDFESSLSNIKAVSGATGEEMNKLKALALQAGKDTAFSAKESSDAICELMKAGVATKDILGGGLKGALDLAVAGDLNLAEAAEIASTALNAFKADSLTVAKAGDILAGAANASATDVKELKFALSMVSAVASGVGLSFEDTNRALAVFAQNGLIYSSVTRRLVA